MKKLIKLFIVMVVLCTTACTQILENRNDIDQIKSYGRLVMKVENKLRSINPTFQESDIKSAVLTANGNEIKSWSGDNIISQIENTEDILLDVGNYDFTMTFSNADNIDILTASTNQDIVAGNNSLVFDMKPVTTGNGDISITLTWDVSNGIDKITAGLYDIATNDPLEGFEDSVLEITTSNEQISTAPYSLSGVPVGQYIIKFKIYECETYEKLLNTLSEVINVAAGITTSSQITLSKINTQYSIIYDTNGGKWADNFIPTYNHNANEKIILPTAGQIIHEDGYKFGGWYDDNNNRITEIPSDTAKDISVTAKWYNAICDISNVCDVIALLSGTGPHDILVTGEMNSDFIAVSIKKVFDDNKNIKNVNLDLSQTTGMTKITPWAFEGMSGLSSVILPDSVTSIGDTAFRNCSNLTSINIPYGVTSIETETFKGCVSLTEIIIPDSVTTIGSNAFSNCTNLKSIIIPNSVTEIQSFAFYICSNLTSITIPNSVTSIGASAFRETGLLNIELPNSITVIDDYLFLNCASLESITIPSTITSINQYAFSGAGLKEVSIPNSVTSIAPGAFYGCSSLSKVELPTGGLREIRYDTFYNCDSLTEVVIPNNVTEISDAAFYDCDNLKKVTIPAGVTNISSSAFRGCNQLTNFDIDANNTTYSSLDNGKILCKGTTLFCYPGASGEVSIPDEVTTIDYNAFDECNAVKTLVIGNNLTSFDNLPITSALESITIGDGITEIGAEKFKDFKNLTSVTIGGGVTKIGTSAFSGCTGLTSVTIGSGVKTIDGYAFGGCTGLTSVTIGSGVKTIDGYAFAGCTGLTSVEIPNNVTNISGSAFHSCSNLTEFIVSGDHTAYSSSEDNKVLYNTEKTTLFAYPSATGAVTIPDNVTTIGESAFEGCSSLTSVKIPDGVTTIDSYAFYGCSNLASVTIPDSVTSIGSSAFGFCSSLTSVTIPDGVTTIGSYAFRDCSKLASVTIGKKVTSIADYAFWCCGKLTSVTIPVSVIEIDYSAFLDCSSLTTVNYRGTEEEWGKITISGENDILTKATIIYNYQEE